MNQRLAERTEILGEMIRVSLTSNGREFMTVQLKDISTIGISFFAYEHEVRTNVGKEVHAFFMYEGVPVQVELDILREKETKEGLEGAGKFIGLPSKLICPVRPKNRVEQALVLLS